MKNFHEGLGMPWDVTNVDSVLRLSGSTSCCASWWAAGVSGTARFGAKTLRHDLCDLCVCTLYIAVHQMDTTDINRYQQINRIKHGLKGWLKHRLRHLWGYTSGRIRCQIATCNLQGRCGPTLTRHFACGSGVIRWYEMISDVLPSLLMFLTARWAGSDWDCILPNDQPDESSAIEIFNVLRCSSMFLHRGCRTKRQSLRPWLASCSTACSS